MLSPSFLGEDTVSGLLPYILNHPMICVSRLVGCVDTLEHLGYFDNLNSIATIEGILTIIMLLESIFL